jgi:hypothetical protein
MVSAYNQGHNMMCDMWYGMCDMWYRMCDMWYGMCDMWYEIRVTANLRTMHKIAVHAGAKGSGWELRHLAGLPGGGGIFRLCHTLVRVNTV